VNTLNGHDAGEYETTTSRRVPSGLSRSIPRGGMKRLLVSFTDDEGVFHAAGPDQVWWREEAIPQKYRKFFARDAVHPLHVEPRRPAPAGYATPRTATTSSVTGTPRTTPLRGEREYYRQPEPAPMPIVQSAGMLAGAEFERQVYEAQRLAHQKAAESDAASRQSRADGGWR
jgi:hypothetical protein